MSLTADQIAELRNSFAAIDANHDGQVSKDELKAHLQKLGDNVTDDVVDELMGKVDENGDGKIDFEEFVKAVSAGVL